MTHYATSPMELPPVTKPTVQVDAEHQRPRVTRALVEAPTTVKTAMNIVRRATHDLDEGIY